MRKRENPQKKWSEKENSLILEYLLENVEIEPNAQLYYRKMIERTQIDATPEMLRCKVRYWKQTFNKAEQWRKSTGAGLDVGDEASTIKEKLLKICPSYDRFSLLFGGKAEANCIAESYTFDVPNCSSDFNDFTELLELAAESPAQPSALSAQPSVSTLQPSVSSAQPSAASTQPSALSAQPEELPQSEIEAAPLPRTSFLDKVKKRAPKNTLSELKEMQKKREQFFEKRIQIEEEKLKLEKLKIEMEKEKSDKEFELKKMELEQKERLAMLELKYKYNRE